MSLRKYVEQALFCGTLRGADSTGAFVIDRNTREVETYKKALPGPDFLNWRPFASSLAKMDEHVALIGHNRAATKGAVTVRNAHPFTRGPITLVHNGTMLSTYGADNVLGAFTDEVVDSAKIAAALAATEDPLSVLPKLHGSFALVWYDARTGQLYVSRNDERTLFFSLNEAQTTMAIASELTMLEWLTERNDLDMKKRYYFNKHTLFALNLTGKQVTWKQTEYKPEPQTYGGYGNYKGGYRSSYASEYDETGVWEKRPRGSKKSVATKIHEQILSRLNVEMDDEHMFYPKKWLQYPNSEYGAVHGYIYSRTKPIRQINAVLNGVHKASYDKSVADVPAKISGAGTGEHALSKRKREDYAIVTVRQSQKAVQTFGLREEDGAVTYLSRADWETEVGPCLWCNETPSPHEGVNLHWERRTISESNGKRKKKTLAEIRLPLCRGCALQPDVRMALEQEKKSK